MPHWLSHCQCWGQSVGRENDLVWAVGTTISVPPKPRAVSLSQSCQLLGGAQASQFFFWSILIKLCHHKQPLECSQTIEAIKFLLLYWNKPGIQLHSQQAPVSLLEWMPEGLRISIFPWLSLFLLNACQGSNVWDLHPHPWSHSACRTSRDCAIKIHSAARNCDNGGKMSQSISSAALSQLPRNTETASWPCRLTQP